MVGRTGWLLGLAAVAMIVWGLSYAPTVLRAERVPPVATPVEVTFAPSTSVPDPVLEPATSEPAVAAVTGGAVSAAPEAVTPEPVVVIVEAPATTPTTRPCLIRVTPGGVCVVLGRP